MTSASPCIAPSEISRESKTETWRWLPFLCEDPPLTMDRDRAILNHLKEGPLVPTLRFYKWAGPALSYGKTQGIALESKNLAASRGLAIVQRPTGGGIVEHGNDLCFSIFWDRNSSIPWKVAESYLRIHEWIAESLREIGIPAQLIHQKTRPDNGWCFQSAVCYDLMLEGRKIVGGAQWRERTIALHQGSIQADLPESALPVFKMNFEQLFGASF